MMEHPLFVLVDLLGTVGFAIRGRRHRRDPAGGRRIRRLLVNVAPWFAVSTCLVIRVLAIRCAWALPVVGRR